MARSKVEACMFCAPDPCECNAKPKKQASTPRKRPVEVHTREQLDGGVADHRGDDPSSPQGGTAPRLDIKAKMKAAAQAKVATPQLKDPPKTRRQSSPMVEEVARKAPAPVLSDEQLLEQAALRALGPIMHSSERERYRMLLSDPSPATRRAEWKARRRANTG